MTGPGGVLVLTAALSMLAFRNWRFGLRLLLFTLVVEGAVRKWVFPDAQQVLYFMKDGILAGAFAGYLRTGARIVVPRGLRLAILIVIIIAAVNVFNPALPSLLLGLVGLKSYVLYSLLLILVPAAWPAPAHLESFLRHYVLLAIPTAIIAAIQFHEPLDSAWNRYSNEGSIGVAGFGDINRARVTSSFPYITGYTSYLFTAAMLVLALLAIRQFAWRGNRGLWGAAMAVLVALPMTGSRWPIYALIISVPAFMLLLLFRGRLSGHIVLRGIAGMIVLAFVLTHYASGPVDAFARRAAGTGEEDRIASYYRQPLDAAITVGPLGDGTGATHNAAPSIVRDMAPYSWLGAAAFRYEDEDARVVVELGIIGFVAVFWLRLSLIVFALRQTMTATQTSSLALAAAASIHLVMDLTTAVIFNPTSGVYFWFMAGVVMVVYSHSRAGLRIPAPKLYAQDLGRPSGPPALAPGRAGTL